MKRKYYVTTWDADTQQYTPQSGVRVGPYTLFGLRKALLALREIGYEIRRAGAFGVLVEREDSRTLRVTSPRSSPGADA